MTLDSTILGPPSYTDLTKTRFDPKEYEVLQGKLQNQEGSTGTEDDSISSLSFC